jgi:ArsR family transcriptional regulator, cadmium/lead-responsive transcriptional repressor
MIDAIAPDHGTFAPDAALDQRQEVTAKFFHGLSDLTRLRIVELLLDEGEQNVSELVARLGQPQSCVSNHLACLRWCGYVDSRREGKFVYYRVADPRLREILTLSREVIADHAAAILGCARM